MRIMSTSRSGAKLNEGVLAPCAPTAASRTSPGTQERRRLSYRQRRPPKSGSPCAQGLMAVPLSGDEFSRSVCVSACACMQWCKPPDRVAGAPGMALRHRRSAAGYTWQELAHVRWAELGAVFHERRRIAARSLPLAPQAAHVHARTLRAEKNRARSHRSAFRAPRPPPHQRRAPPAPERQLAAASYSQTPCTATPCPCSAVHPFGEPSVVRP